MNTKSGMRAIFKNTGIVKKVKKSSVPKQSLNKATLNFILKVIKCHKTILRTELIEKTGYVQSTIGNYLAELEIIGCIKRKRDRNDRGSETLITWLKDNEAEDMKASEIIKVSCCGQGLPIDCPRTKLVEKVETLENEIVLLTNQLENAIAEINKSKG